MRSMGWMAPVSLFECMTVTRAVSGAIGAAVDPFGMVALVSSRRSAADELRAGVGDQVVVRVLRDGEHTGQKPGRVVRGPGWETSSGRCAP